MTFLSTVSGEFGSAIGEEPDKVVRPSGPVRANPTLDGTHRFTEGSRSRASFMKFAKPGGNWPAPAGDFTGPETTGRSVRAELLRLRTLRLFERRSRGVGGDNLGDNVDVAELVALGDTRDDP